MTEESKEFKFQQNLQERLTNDGNVLNKTTFVDSLLD